MLLGELHRLLEADGTVELVRSIPDVTESGNHYDRNVSEPGTKTLFPTEGHSVHDGHHQV